MCLNETIREINAAMENSPLQQTALSVEKVNNLIDLLRCIKHDLLHTGNVEFLTEHRLHVVLKDLS